MLRILQTFDGHTINDGSNYRAVILNPYSTPPASPAFLQMPNADSEDVGVFTVDTHTLVVQIEIRNYANRQALIAQLQGWFKRGTLGDLVTLFADDGLMYFRPCRVVNLVQTPDFPFHFIATLNTGWTTWRAVNADSDGWNLTGTGGTYNLELEGDDETPLSVTFELLSSPSSGYQYQRLYELINKPGINLGYGPWSITLDTAALVTATKMQADCDDLRIFVNGQETKRWIANPNNAATKVWFNATISAGYSLPLRVALDSSSDYQTIAFNVTPDVKDAIAALPGEGILVHGTEWIKYRKHLGSYGVLLIERGVLGTTKQAHAINDVFTYMENVITIVYGNSTVTDPALVDTAYDDTKPLFLLTSSSNTSWVYDATTLFADLNGTGRTGGFKPSNVLRAGDISNYYSIKENAASGDPSMGMLIGAFQKTTGWAPELAFSMWSFERACGINTTTFTGRKYRTHASWPTLADLRNSIDGSVFNQVWNEATPGSASTWTALATHSADAMGGARWLRLVFKGSIEAAANAKAMFEILTGTINFVSANLPTASLLSEKANGQLELTLDNGANEDALDVNIPMLFDLPLALDGEAKTVLYNNVRAHEVMRLNDESRSTWLRLVPGTNLLTITSVDTGDLTVLLNWYRRRF